MPQLKPKYEEFCRLYLACHNASEAAEQAGYSHESRHKQGHRLLRRPAIVARIAELRAEIAERECRSEAALLAKLEAAHRRAARADNPLWAAQVVKLQATLPALLAQSRLASSRAGAEDRSGIAAVAETAQATRAALVALARQLGVTLPELDGAAS